MINYPDCGPPASNSVISVWAADKSRCVIIIFINLKSIVHRGMNLVDYLIKIHLQ